MGMKAKYFGLYCTLFRIFYIHLLQNLADARLDGFHLVNIVIKSIQLQKVGRMPSCFVDQLVVIWLVFQTVLNKHF